MASMFKVSSNARSVINALGKMDELLNRATAASLKRVGEAVKKEGSRIVRDSHYASAKLSVGKIYKWVHIRDHAYGEVDFSKQWIEIDFSRSGFPLMYFSPRNTVHNTRRGKRYGVSVTQYGKRIETGGYHVKGKGRSQRQGSPKGVGTFDETSRVFKRSGEFGLDGNEKSEMFKFYGAGHVLEIHGRIQELQAYGYRKLDEYLEREFNRAAFVLQRELKEIGI